MIKTDSCKKVAVLKCEEAIGHPQDPIARPPEPRSYASGQNEGL